MSPIYVPGKVVLTKTYVEGDLNYSNVSLLLHGNGTNGSTTITDNSPSPKTVTAVGNAQISTAQSKFGGSSILLDGNGDFLSAPSSIDFSDFGLTNWTLEAWIYVLSSKNQMIINLTNTLTSNSGLGFSLSDGNNLKLDNGIAAGINAGSVSLNAWVHVAAVRNSSTTTAFVNGLSVGTTTQTPNISQFAYVGRAADSSVPQFFNGYIDDLRITKGVARYTANFTPPTAPFADAQF
jgi:hypothetical protein